MYLFDTFNLKVASSKKELIMAISRNDQTLVKYYHLVYDKMVNKA